MSTPANPITGYATKGTKGTLVSLIAGTLFYAPVVGLESPASAQSYPDCKSVQPSIGLVCYTDDPMSIRQKDVGGTKVWDKMIERWSDGWIIEGHEIIDTGGQFGTFTKPNCSTVSGSGTASISSEAASLASRQSSITASLRAKAATVTNPTIKAEIEQKIDASSRAEETLSTSQSAIVSKGNNEALQCQATTYVKCNYFYCGDGAAWSGNIRVYRRYLGNINDIRALYLDLGPYMAELDARIQAEQSKEEARKQEEAAKEATKETDITPANDSILQKAIRFCKKKYSDKSSSRKQCINKMKAKYE